MIDNKALKIILIMQGISRLVHPMIESPHQIVGIIDCCPRKGSNQRPLILKIFAFLYRIFRPARGLKDLAQSLQIPYYYMDKGSDINLQNWVKNLNPDLIFIFGMSQLLSAKIFNIPKYGTINLHPSMLPEYRGPNPDFWQYYNMEMNPGVTIHFIDKGEDTGDILLQERTHIPLGTRSPERLDILAGQTGVRLTLKVMDDIKNDQKLNRIKQTEKSPTDRARAVKANEHQNLINWEKWEIDRIWHILRGTETWLDALKPPFIFSSLYIGHRWTIEEMQKCDIQDYELKQIYKEKKRYFVICQNGKIYLSVTFHIKTFILGLLNRQ